MAKVTRATLKKWVSSLEETLKEKNEVLDNTDNTDNLERLEEELELLENLVAFLEEYIDL